MSYLSGDDEQVYPKTLFFLSWDLDKDQRSNLSMWKHFSTIICIWLSQWHQSVNGIRLEHDTSSLLETSLRGHIGRDHVSMCLSLH